MKISELPEVTNATSGLTFPLVSPQGQTQQLSLSTLQANVTTTGTVTRVVGGSSVTTDPLYLSRSGTLKFYLPGAIFPFPSQQPPDGWLLCNGQEVSRRDYADLFSAISITYGLGNGRTTFNLPDLRGRTVAGFELMGGGDSSGRLTASTTNGVNGSSMGAVGGLENHTLTPQESGLNQHTHTHDVSVSWGGDYEDGNSGNGGNGQSSSRWPGSQFTLAWNYSFTSDAASDSSAQPHPNLPPLVFLNWVIKY
jgi:microcystin-dependent protein